MRGDETVRRICPDEWTGGTLSATLNGSTAIRVQQHFQTVLTGTVTYQVRVTRLTITAANGDGLDFTADNTADSIAATSAG